MCGLAAVLIGCALASTALAQAGQTCLQVEEKRQIETQHVDAQGQRVVKLKEATNMSRGQTVLFTLKATNVCDAAINPAVINFSVPERVSYLLGTAAGSGTDITFSISGKSFGKFESLAIHDAGDPRAARAEDIKYIRWVLHKPLAPNASRTVRFRATVQ
jgi:hypothetical protein